jgi:hypothetical protein
MLVEDCDESEAAVHPLANDVCEDGLDQDCDGRDADCEPVDCDLPENAERPECTCAGGPCGAGESCCDDACVDTRADPANCGGCGVACEAPSANGCEGSECRCGAGAACGPGGTCVGGACICDEGLGDCTGGPADGCETDLTSDSAHCGACDAACPAGIDCDAGSCGCTDDADCGANGDCVAGVCGCQDGFADCAGGIADGCEVDSSSDEANCGACGTACNGAETCSFGECRCGAGDACGPSSSCVGITCVCDAGRGDCAGGRADGCEADVSADDANCGACGNACVGDETCVDSVCDCGGAGECPDTFTCEIGECHCDLDADCDGPGGGTFTCRANGRCRCSGVNCGLSEWCEAGVCTPVP